MIQYIYFVKCPGCEDESFEFFDAAKEYAMSKLSQKPIITQTEFCNNNSGFGECTGSNDLGTVWSWEDMMDDIPTDPELTTFSKSETLGISDDSEFDDDFSFLDELPDNYRGSKNPAELAEDFNSEFNEVYIEDGKRVTKEQLYQDVVENGSTVIINLGEWEANPHEVFFSDGSRYSDSELQITFDPLFEEFTAVVWHNSDDGDQTEGDYFYKTPSFDRLWRELIDFDYHSTIFAENLRKPVPSGMTVEQLVEEMEENEDAIECKWCHELFDKSECRYEVDLGWLCPQCEAAIKSRGEELTFREGMPKLSTWIRSFDGKELGTVKATNEPEAYEKMEQTWPDLNYGLYDGVSLVYPEDESLVESSASAYYGSVNSSWPDGDVALEYDDLWVEYGYGGMVDNDWYSPPEPRHWFSGTVSHTYYADPEDVAVLLFENCLTDEDVEGVPGGLEAMSEDDELFNTFFEKHFDDLVEKYQEFLLGHYEEAAAEDYVEKVDDDDGPDPDAAYERYRDERDFD
jgi:hypothetical protein